MNNNGGSGFHKVSIWAINAIPLFAVAVCWFLVLCTIEFIDGVKGVNCNAPLNLVTAPHQGFNKVGCVINGVRDVMPSRGGGGNNTAP
jgi:hypothetical protein